VPDLNGILDRQQRLIQLGIFGIAAIVGFAESRADRTVAISMYLLIPVAAAALGSMWFQEIERLRDIADLSSKESGSPGLFGKEVDRALRLIKPLQIGVLLACGLAAALSWREIDGVILGNLDNPSPFSGEMTAVFVGLWMLGSALAIVTVFRPRFGAKG
jgi:hypothetical protein